MLKVKSISISKKKELQNNLEKGGIIESRYGS